MRAEAKLRLLPGEKGPTPLYCSVHIAAYKLSRGRQRCLNYSRNFHFELPLHPKTYAFYPGVSSANCSGLFEVEVRLILAVLRSRCVDFARPSLPRR